MLLTTIERTSIIWLITNQTRWTMMSRILRTRWCSRIHFFTYINQRTSTIWSILFGPHLWYEIVCLHYRLWMLWMRKQQLCTYILSQLKQVTMDLTTVSSRVLFLTKPFRSPPRLVLSAHYSPAGGTRHPKSTIKLITQTAPRLVTSSIMVSGYTTQSALTYLFPKVQYSTIQLVHPLRQPFVYGSHHFLSLH